MMYYNPYISGQYNPLYTLNNQCFFIAHNDFFSGLPYKTLEVLLKVTCVHANFMQLLVVYGDPKNPVDPSRRALVGLIDGHINSHSGNPWNS